MFQLSIILLSDKPNTKYKLSARNYPGLKLKGIKMKQNPNQHFISECGRASIFVANDMPIGVFHDFLMELKGMMVDRMVAAHKEQVEIAEAQKKQEAVEESCCKGELDGS